MDEITACPICSNARLTTSLRCKDHTVSLEEFSILRCPLCDLGITSPRPRQLEKYYASNNYISHTSSGKGIINKLYLIARRYTLNRKLKLINRFSARGSLLDYGCGTGDFLRQCERASWSVTGVEPSERALKLAKTASVHVYRELPENKIYDIITLWHVLEHVPDLNHIVEKLKGCLAENGTLFIAVPNMKSHDAKHYNSIWAGYDVPRHLWHFSPTAMKKLLEKHALRFIDTKPMKLDSYYVSILSEKYSNNSSFMALIKGVFNGFFSNISARKTGHYSSLIYIAKK